MSHRKIIQSPYHAKSRLLPYSTRNKEYCGGKSGTSGTVLASRNQWYWIQKEGVAYAPLRKAVMESHREYQGSFQTPISTLSCITFIVFHSLSLAGSHIRHLHKECLWRHFDWSCLLLPEIYLYWEMKRRVKEQSMTLWLSTLVLMSFPRRIMSSTIFHGGLPRRLSHLLKRLS